MVRESFSHPRWDPHADMAESERVRKDAPFFSDQEPSSTIPPGFIEVN